MLSLDGTWEFFPGPYELDELDRVAPETIVVPGLWEAQGRHDLDGVAWYRRSFEVDDADGAWALAFGAVMDVADVFVNGEHVGHHDGAFTPFDVDVTGRLRTGENSVAVRVFDPPVGHHDHARMPHGKQGWNNGAFPSRPSLYLTYGGIWQPVALRRPPLVRDVFVNSDPDDLRVSFDARGPVRVETLGMTREGVGEVSFGRVDAPRWSPGAPHLHELVVGDVAVRYGLRTVRVRDGRIFVNDVPYRMKSVLVQGFHDTRLYAEGTREEIEAEVRAARELGFNTVRLHVKAFDPVYLDVCDELGMLVHCDLPVAEPVAYAELGADTVLARRCVQTAREQVRRDRNHPSLVLWSAMNEIGERRIETRAQQPYKDFVRALYDAIVANDGTRPVIENDWIELMGSTVYHSPILTAHWYGRLHRDYFDKVDRKLSRWHADPRVLLVSEYGDWGLPELPEHDDPPFWDARAKYAAAVAETLWPGDVESFFAETQRYQGWSDRLQAEVFRRHDRVSGWCLTELTDVPQELNGLLDIHRAPKPQAVEEVRRGNQVVLPMLDLRSFVVRDDEPVRAALHVANDGPARDDVTVEANGVELWRGRLGGYRAQRLGDVELAPAEEIVLRIRGIAENRYRLRVLAPPPRVDLDRPDVVREGELRERLDPRAPMLVLAQPADAARFFPEPLELRALDTRWASSAFAFTTGRSDFTALPRAGMLVGEDATIHARAIVVGPVDDRLVVRFNPTGTTGTLVGRIGRVLFCQYRLEREAAAGDLAARALLADLLRAVS